MTYTERVSKADLPTGIQGRSELKQLRGDNFLLKRALRRIEGDYRSYINKGISKDKFVKSVYNNLSNVQDLYKEVN